MLCLQGFLAARKHADRIILLAEMMQHSGCPCFKSGSVKALSALRKRFHMTSTEAQARLLPCAALRWPICTGPLRPFLPTLPALVTNDKHRARRSLSGAPVAGATINSRGPVALHPSHEPAGD